MPEAAPEADSREEPARRLAAGNLLDVSESLSQQAEAAVGDVVEGTCPLCRVDLKIHDDRAWQAHSSWTRNSTLHSGQPASITEAIARSVWL